MLDNRRTYRTWFPFFVIWDGDIEEVYLNSRGEPNTREVFR